MIPKHIERRPRNDNYRALALYAADAKMHGETGEKTLMSWHEGCLAEDYLSSMIEVEATQAMNTRTTKEKTYHLMVSFRPEDEAKLSPDVFKNIEKALARAIGFSDHQRHCGVHKNTDNMHMHIAFNMINPMTFNRHAPFYDHQKLHQACRELEKKYGLAVDNGIEDSHRENAPKRHVKAATVEAQTGQQSFFNFVAGQKGEILEIVKKAGNWHRLHEDILKLGLEIRERGRGLIIKDRCGKHAVKASDADRSLSKANMEKLLGPFRKLSPDQEASTKFLQNYGSVPLHKKDYQRDQLYAQFQVEMERRNAALASVKEREGIAYKSNIKKWDDKRKAIGNIVMLPAHKRQILQTINAREEAELAASRLALTEERAAIRKSIPYTSWTKFLQHQAAQGNESALSVLRSKKIQPQISITTSDDRRIPDLAAQMISKEQQAAVISAQGINQKHRRALLAVIKMKELLSKNPDFELSDMKYKIDTKGVVIFTLKTGGSIRDNGSELHISPNDQYAKKIMEVYEKMEWGGVSLKDANALAI